jgi:hypothetical protein
MRLVITNARHSDWHHGAPTGITPITKEKQ